MDPEPDPATRRRALDGLMDWLLLLAGVALFCLLVKRNGANSVQFLKEWFDGAGR